MINIIDKKPRIFYVPIEPLEERYTEQWYRNFQIEFREAGFEVIVIDGGTLTSYVETGTFLDINSTVHYKAEQLRKISVLFFKGEIKDGDIFFIADLEFFGIEALRYLADVQNIKIKIYGFLHAGSYTKEDYMEKCADYAKYFELGWLKICDKVFVGTEYHRRAVWNRRIIKLRYGDFPEQERHSLYSKIFVSGNPLFRTEYKLSNDLHYYPKPEKKKNQIIISNRFDWEKRPNLSLDFMYLVKKKYGQDINIIVTTSRPKFKSNRQWLVDYARELEKDGIITIYEGLTKEEYHRRLAESKIMLTNSIEENFGYCVMEACVYNTYPLCPNACSHPELLGFDSRLLYNNEDEIMDKIDFLLKCQTDITIYAHHYYNSVKRMIDIMKWDD